MNSPPPASLTAAATDGFDRGIKPHCDQLQSENQVLDASILHFENQGYRLIYRTNCSASKGGVDAILYKLHTPQFVFIEAKGPCSTGTTRSARFNAVLGSILKRIKMTGGYTRNCSLNESRVFIPEPYKTELETSANHSNSRYVVSVTSDYKNTIASCIDPAIASLLRLEFCIISKEGSVSSFELKS